MKGLLIFALGLLLLLVGGFFVDEAIHTYNVEARLRVTVEVKDGDQIKTGSSVIAEAFQMFRNFGTGSLDNRVSPTGYAPTVDLGDKGLLLLTFMDATRTPQQAIEQMKKFHCRFGDFGCLPFAAYHIPSESNSLDQVKDEFRTLLKQSGSRDVSFADLPGLFRVVDDDSAYANLPWEHWKIAHNQAWHNLVNQLTVQPNDLAARFGQGVFLKRVIVELTNDPVTPQPAIWPPWLRDKAVVAMGDILVPAAGK